MILFEENWEQQSTFLNWKSWHRVTIEEDVDILTDLILVYASQ